MIINWWIIRQRGVDRTLTIVSIAPRWLISWFLGRQVKRYHCNVYFVWSIFSRWVPLKAPLNYGNAFAETLIGVLRNKSNRRACLASVPNHISSRKCNGLPSLRLRCPSLRTQLRSHLKEFFINFPSGFIFYKPLNSQFADTLNI